MNFPLPDHFATAPSRFFRAGAARGPGGRKDVLRLELYAALAILDGCYLAFAYMLAALSSFGTVIHDQLIFVFLLHASIFFAISINSRAYHVDALRTPPRGIERAVRATFLASAILVGIIFYLDLDTRISHRLLALGLILSAIFISIGRWIFGRVVGSHLRWSFSEDLLLVEEDPHIRFDGPTIRIDALDLHPTNDDPIMLDRLGHLVEKCDRVILACRADRRRIWVRMLKGAGVDVEVLTPELKEIGVVHSRTFQGLPTLLVSTKPLGLRDRMIKRSFDLVVACLALAVLAPLLLAVALAVRLDSPGPVLFRQPRVGQGNRIFQIFKFRTMRSEAADLGGERSTRPDDARLTRIGGFLRKSSIDELPQLFNVLLGDMSLVGPRPHALASTAEGAFFWDIDPRYWERHCAKPGITGLAQVRGYRGATCWCDEVTARIQSDLEYVRNWKLSRDILILIRTMRVLFHPKAY